MVTIIKTLTVYGMTKTEVYGLSTDEKPKDCKNASVFYEMDTKKMYLFDEQNHVWIEQ